MAPAVDLRSVTAFRFLAALHVLVLHEFLGPGELTWAGPTTAILLERTAALSFFFLVGGMLLTYVYWGRVEGPRERRTFWLGRFARLYPLYLVGLALFLPLSVARWTAAGAPPWEMVRAFVAQVLLLQAWFPSMPEPWYINRPAWTISTFVLFYAALPWTVRILRRLSVPRLWAVFWLLLALSQALVWLFETKVGVAGRDLEVLHKLPPVRWPEFLMGQTLGAIVVQGGHRRGWLRHPATFPLAGAAAVALFVWLPFRLDNHIHNGLLLPVLGIVLLASLHAPPAAAWLWTRPMQRLGQTSFTFYILHLAVGNYLSGAFTVVTGLFGTPWSPRLSTDPVATWAFIALDIAVLVPLSLWVHDRVEDPVRSTIKTWWERRTR